MSDDKKEPVWHDFEMRGGHDRIVSVKIDGVETVKKHVRGDGRCCSCVEDGYECCNGCGDDTEATHG